DVHIDTGISFVGCSCFTSPTGAAPTPTSRLGVVLRNLKAQIPAEHTAKTAAVLNASSHLSHPLSGTTAAEATAADPDIAAVYQPVICATWSGKSRLTIAGVRTLPIPIAIDNSTVPKISET